MLPAQVWVKGGWSYADKDLPRVTEKVSYPEALTAVPVPHSPNSHLLILFCRQVINPMSKEELSPHPQALGLPTRSGGTTRAGRSKQPTAWHLVAAP